MKEGDVVLTPVPQADGQIKNRPALFLRTMPPFNDALVCGISTQLQQQVAGFDEVVRRQDADSPKYAGRLFTLTGSYAVRGRTSLDGRDLKINVGNVDTSRRQRSTGRNATDSGVQAFTRHNEAEGLVWPHRTRTAPVCF